MMTIKKLPKYGWLSNSVALAARAGGAGETGMLVILGPGARLKHVNTGYPVGLTPSAPQNDINCYINAFGTYDTL